MSIIGAKCREPGEAVGTGLAGTEMLVLGEPLSRGRRSMVYLRLRKLPRIEPLQKAPLFFRVFVTVVAILVVLSVLATIESQLERIGCSAEMDPGWEMITE